MGAVLKPQEGPQTDFLSSHADIVIYGGAAGGGKSFGLLLDPCRYHNTKSFRGVIFRRTLGEFKDGGLWDESFEVMPHIGAAANESNLVWKFPGGGSLKFAGMEHEKDRFKHQGKQYSFIGFDELTQFTEKQFWYLVSRMRDAKSGIKPYLRATCNPDPDSFVKKLISWWLDDEGRFADPEKSGVVRYIYRYEDEDHFADTREELMDEFGLEEHEVMSITFIPSSLQDNKILMENDPSYLSKLNAQNRVDRARLLGGDWLIKESAGEYFQRIWFKPAKTAPDRSQFEAIVRAWDFAATDKNNRNKKNKDPDYTAAVLMGMTYDKKIYVLDVYQDRISPAKVEEAIKYYAALDEGTWGDVKIIMPEDPGQAGKFQSNHFSRTLHGYDFAFLRPVNDKITRAKAYSAQVEHGNVYYLINSDWNDKYMNELECFPDGNHDDMVDGSSDAYNTLVGPVNEITTEELPF